MYDAETFELTIRYLSTQTWRHANVSVSVGWSKDKIPRSTTWIISSVNFYWHINLIHFYLSIHPSNNYQQFNSIFINIAEKSERQQKQFQIRYKLYILDAFLIHLNHADTKADWLNIYRDLKIVIFIDIFFK